MTAVSPYDRLLAEFERAYRAYEEDGLTNLRLVAHEFPIGQDDYEVPAEELTKLRYELGLQPGDNSQKQVSEPCPTPKREPHVSFVLYYDGTRINNTAQKEFIDLATNGGAVAAGAGAEQWCILIHKWLREPEHADRIDNHVCYRQPFLASILLIKELAQLAAASSEANLIKLQSTTATGAIANSGRISRGPARTASTARRSESADAWQFVADGDGYNITGLGESGRFRRLKGFEYIEKILAGRGKPVPMLAIIADAGSAPRRLESAQAVEGEFSTGISPLGVQSRQETLDDDAWQQIEARYHEIQEELPEADMAGNIVRVGELKEEQRLLAHEMKQAKGFGGRDRDLNSETNKRRSRISNRLSYAYKKMREAKSPLNKLAGHLEVSISAEGDSYRYTASPRPDWDIG